MIVKMTLSRRRTLPSLLLVATALWAAGVAAQSASAPQSAAAALSASSALPRGVPEAEGVSSEGIAAFLDALVGSPHELHSVVLVRHGKVVAEGWWAPYAPELTHTMYSTSKSF